MALTDPLTPLLESLNAFMPPLNCLYSNTYGMGNKQEELEICVWTMISLGLQRHGGIAHMTGMLPWMAMYFLGKTGNKSRWWSCSLYKGEQLECMVLCLGLDEERVESL